MGSPSVVKGCDKLCRGRSRMFDYVWDKEMQSGDCECELGDCSKNETKSDRNVFSFISK